MEQNLNLLANFDTTEKYIGGAHRLSLDKANDNNDKK